MDLYTQNAMAAADEALRSAGLYIEPGEKRPDGDRFGAIVPSGIGGLGTLEREHETLLNRGPRRVSPFLIPMMILDMASGSVSMRIGAKGPNFAAVTACATASHSIGESYWTVSRGDADIMITGGAEASISRLGVGGFCAMKALSTRNDDPKHASRPFDKDRDGFVMSEGAGILVLEEMEHAKKRGAKIYGEIIGYGATGDAYHITSPAPGGEGGARAMKMAMKNAGINPEDVRSWAAQSADCPSSFGTATVSIFGPLLT